jgi:hypothetical protein
MPNRLTQKWLNATLRAFHRHKYSNTRFLRKITTAVFYYVEASVFLAAPRVTAYRAWMSTAGSAGVPPAPYSAPLTSEHGTVTTYHATKRCSLSPFA